MSCFRCLQGLEPLHLRVLSVSSDDPTERWHADRVLKLLNRGRHWVLVVLLLGNVVRSVHDDGRPSQRRGAIEAHLRVIVAWFDASLRQIVNESLPIFLDKVLGGGISAVIASTVLIGESCTPPIPPRCLPLPSGGSR